MDTGNFGMSLSLTLLVLLLCVVLLKPESFPVTLLVYSRTLTFSPPAGSAGVYRTYIRPPGEMSSIPRQAPQGRSRTFSPVRTTISP